MSPSVYSQTLPTQPMAECHIKHLDRRSTVRIIVCPFRFDEGLDVAQIRHERRVWVKGARLSGRVESELHREEVREVRVTGVVVVLLLDDLHGLQ